MKLIDIRINGENTVEMKLDNGDNIITVNRAQFKNIEWTNMNTERSNFRINNDSMQVKFDCLCDVNGEYINVDEKPKYRITTYIKPSIRDKIKGSEKYFTNESDFLKQYISIINSGYKDIFAVNLEEYKNNKWDKYKI